MDRSLARLPRRDVLMAAILFAVMAAADVAAWIFDVPDRARPAFVLLPFSLALVWISYSVSLRRRFLRGADARSLRKLSAFWGRSLSLIGCVMTVAHVALLASFVRPGVVTSEQFVRAFMTALGVVVVVMFNGAPKLLPAAGDAPRGLGIHRAAAWTGVGSGIAIIAAAWLAPRPVAPFLVFPFAMLPAAVNYIARMPPRRGR